MADLILQLIFFSSFAIIVYLMAVAVPRVKDDDLTANGGKASSILPLERMDAFLNSWKEKILRRLRIYLMRAERGVTNQLDKSREVYRKERQKKRLFRTLKHDKTAKPPEETPEEQS
ncbi:MAG: hypothetical protein HYW38_01845 [Candidatus Colwellbacteria bacterium]|nr:hypothetical protein [Candidatus Colwellbacteria bacterium]